MKATIKDVASHAGVSIKTVSRVINKETAVRQQTVDKVMAAVDALNYKPNAAARSLASSSSYVVGFIYDNPNAFYIIELQNGILDACSDLGYELMIHPCDSTSDDICEQLLKMVRHTRVTGLVLTPPFSEMQQVTETLTEAGVQFVRILSSDAPEQDANNCIYVKDKSAAQALTQHLIDQGHKKIAYFTGNDSHNSSRLRQQGYLAAMQKNNLGPTEALIFEGDYSFESGAKRAREVLATPDRPTAIFAANDEVAAAVLFEARRMGVKVPEELSVTGFDDSPFSRQVWPRLTTMHQPNQEIAIQAATLLIHNSRAHKSREQAGVKTEYIPEIRVRESSGKAPF